MGPRIIVFLSNSTLCHGRALEARVYESGSRQNHALPPKIKIFFFSFLFWPLNYLDVYIIMRMPSPICFVTYITQHFLLLLLTIYYSFPLILLFHKNNIICIKKLTHFPHSYALGGVNPSILFIYLFLLSNLNTWNSIPNFNFEIHLFLHK